MVCVWYPTTLVTTHLLRTDETSERNGRGALLSVCVAGGPNMRILFRNSNDDDICCMINHDNMLLTLQCCQLSLFDQPVSILPPVV
ncbi:hypothetical protein TNIN_189011 [Trichonephila inaurata madagascariensis]|uniref:Uncharacterized protein n=1 Tax=Trichonephila inaurata madagascariensis TaxID=2747483 RepID=A0A8X6XEH0_9ARAC|nr:hypothetical protein TNIN_189011 [Trichonephila inaurata madagascariensis]